MAESGKILGVAGPNGAGKSTMIKVLAAEVRGDTGDILIYGETWSPSLADRRVAVVHQEPQLFPNLTVAENIVIGRERSRWLRHGIDQSERALLRRRSRSSTSADEELGDQPLAVQQRTEIARALAQDARVVLFDEPNSALTEEESNDLFRRMHALADAGRTVILVSHRLSELAEHADRVAVILDGRCADGARGRALTAGRHRADAGRGRRRRARARGLGGDARSRAAPAVRLQGLTHRDGVLPRRRPRGAGGDGHRRHAASRGRAPASWCAPSPASSGRRATVEVVDGEQDDRCPARHGVRVRGPRGEPVRAT